MLRSATPPVMYKMISLRFGEPHVSTMDALLALSWRWTKVEPMLQCFTEYHKEIVSKQEGDDIDDNNDDDNDAEEQEERLRERSHLLELVQRWARLSPRLLLDSWSVIRSTARSWQHHANPDGDPERRLRKWLKNHHRAAEEANRERNTATAHLLSLELKGDVGHVVASWEDVMQDTEPSKLAEQIALTDATLLKSVTMEELHQAGEGEVVVELSEEGGAWAALVRRFNVLSGWVVTAVLQGKLPSTRAATVVYFIKLADHLQAVLCDFHGAYAVVSALSDPAVERLSATWARVEGSFVELWQRLLLMWSVDRNFAAYRSEVERASHTPPAVPCCGLLAKDLWAVEQNNGADILRDGVEDKREEGAGLVNVDKLRMLWERMEALCALQREAFYRVPAHPRLQLFLLSLGRPHGMPLAAASSYRSLSLALEPRKKAVPE